ncbi:MAG: tRNA threonylcarbamoyladenosine biosynthesis protein TsaB [Pyrinomonadaceae bacterium]|jgi:tRNA threonylcarbamoyladenosine biosynthesis protein TsaB|nr:tRNA threonylcarbamoyladenosine biosynthesis protein TsaB [Pyrinomonadaceae bacterium]
MSNLRSESETTRPRDAHADAGQTASPDAPLVLSLDTATEVRSVAVVRGVRVLACTRGRVLRENSARVLHEVEEALTVAGVKLAEVELFAAATGPGSFTGLRSGLATVKAFASTLNRRVVGVPTLHAVAYACGATARVVACLPAGRGELFAQLLSVDDAGAVRELSAPSHLSPSALFEKAANWGGDLKWAGTGAHAQAGALREFAAGKGINWRDVEAQGAVESAVEAEVSPVESDAEGEVSWTLAPPSESYAEEIAALGLMSYLKGDTSAAEDLQALYVRLSDAELNERCRA